MVFLRFLLIYFRSETHDSRTTKIQFSDSNSLKVC